MSHALKELQAWYLSNCDGEWEHQYGISVDTLDNPGWHIVIDLYQTSVAHKPFDSVTVDRSEDDWIRCVVKNEQFDGCGGPQNLEEIIEIFIHWVNA